VIAIDIIGFRLEFTKSYAATDVFCPPKPHGGESRIAYSNRSNETLKELEVADTGSNGIGVIIEASGTEVCILTAYSSLSLEASLSRWVWELSTPRCPCISCCPSSLSSRVLWGAFSIRNR